MDEFKTEAKQSSSNAVDESLYPNISSEISEQNNVSTRLIKTLRISTILLAVFTSLFVIVLLLRLYTYFIHDENNYTGGYLTGHLGGVNLNNLIGILYIPLPVSAVMVASVMRNMKKLNLSNQFNYIHKVAHIMSFIIIGTAILLFLMFCYAITHFSWDGLV